nr:Hypothetical protein CBG07069 [Haemonchus contortus]
MQNIPDRKRNSDLGVIHLRRRLSFSVRSSACFRSLMVLYCLKHDCGARLLVLFTDFRLLTCPRCHVGFKYSGWESESVPSPFVDQSSLGCAIIIKPTRGDFLSYGVGDDLHIGISNSMSVVHSYWMNGISSECAGWDKSIVVCRFDDYEDRFDVLLSSFLRENAESFEGEV